MENKVFSKSEKFKSEYSCAVVRVGELTPIEGSDFLAKTLVFGTQIVVRKDQVSEGDIMIYASNETQLDETFLSLNNLFEIGCREKNANADDVNAIMSEYEPYKERADVIRSDAKRLKDSINSMTKKASKINKDIKKKENEIGKCESQESRDAILHEIGTLKEKADELLKKATSKTTVYANMKKEISDIVKSGEHIVAEAKKKVGFFNKYGRVRCITLKNTPSFGFLFKPESLFKYDDTVTMEDVNAYVGEEFDTVNGKLFVKAFVPPVKETPTMGSKTNKAQKKLDRFDRLVANEFFFHYDTAQLQKYINYIKPVDNVAISVKIHGTSIVIAKIHVKNEIRLPFLKRIWNKFVDKTRFLKSLRFVDYTIGYGPVYSSRKTIKNRYINEGVTKGYYGTDVWSEYGDIIYPYLEEGMTVYGEIFGYETGSQKMIQKFYDYGCNKGENKIMFYRITTTKQDGTKTEWNVSDVHEWTLGLIDRMKNDENDNYRKIHPIDILYHGEFDKLYPDMPVSDLWHENVLAKMKDDKEHFGMEQNEPLCKNEVPREGICLRIDDDKMLECFKLKTVSFALKEAVAMDSGEVDIEMMDNYADN